MLTLRADPWAPDYGMGFEAFVEEEAAATIDPKVESSDWSMPITPPDVKPDVIWFVDGVRRADLRLVASEDGHRVSGLIGSYAVGTVKCDGLARFGEYSVGRALILGGGLTPTPATLMIGGRPVAVVALSEPGSDADDSLWRLQRAMREAEASLAVKVANGSGAVVVVDGPLTYHDRTLCPIVGLAKRFQRMYLAPAEAALLAQLRTGQRTPIFLLGTRDSGVQRFAWYVRLVQLRGPWHDHAGLIRCEVRAGIGLADARAVADQVTSALPAFAGRSSDPRTPQNLAPVAGLEAWLRHRMGDTRLVRRAALTWLESGAAA